MSSEYIKFGIKAIFGFYLSNLFLTNILNLKADFINMNDFIEAD